MQRRKRRVLTKKAKFILFLLAVMSVYSMFSAFTPTKADVSDEVKESHYVFVKTGDTLWEIASENNPEQKNVRRWVDEIMEYNNKQNANVYPGEKIILPL